MDDGGNYAQCRCTLRIVMSELLCRLLILRWLQILGLSHHSARTLSHVAEIVTTFIISSKRRSKASSRLLLSSSRIVLSSFS